MIQVRPINHDEHEITAVGAVLVAGFADRSAAWPTLTDAIREVIACSTEHQVSLVATIDDTIVGWISATPQYQHFGWELHPLVVDPYYHRRGIGSALVIALCAQLAARGATTLYAWSDDESQSTSIGGHDLWPDPLSHLATFVPSARHAGGFYRKLGFALCGVLPDANGRGKPDILFVRRIA